VRVIARRPDTIVGFGDTRIHAETATFEVRASEVTNPRPGAQLVVGGETFVIQSEPKPVWSRRWVSIKAGLIASTRSGREIQRRYPAFPSDRLSPGVMFSVGVKATQAEWRRSTRGRDDREHSPSPTLDVTQR
jgi:hypothetical protein